MPEYTSFAAKIKEVGLNSEQGQEAAKIIYSTMSQINRQYILKGESIVIEPIIVQKVGVVCEELVE